jgi:Protein of unknown function (DUF3800)
MLTLYMDESGFTGEDLLSPHQPFFAHASTVLSDEECEAYYAKFFANTHAPELKHKSLCRRPGSRRAIIDFLNSIHTKSDAFTVWVVHKEFALLTYLVDLWVEPLWHCDGLDLYRDGGALAMCNVAYYCLQAFQGAQFLRNHLTRFQRMMMERTRENFRAFFFSIERDFHCSDERTQGILGPIFLAGIKFGYRRLQQIPLRALDPALMTAFESAAYWRKRTSDPLRLVHDASSSLARDRWLWDWITSADIEPRTIGIPGRNTIYPLNVAETEFADSRKFLQLQLCDILAGASVAWCRGAAGVPSDDEYFKQLQDTGVHELQIGCIWPQFEVDPEKLGMMGCSGEGVEFLTEQMKKADPKAGLR